MAKKATRDLNRQEQIAKGPIDLPFLALTLILLGVGLVMLLSASSYSASMDSSTGYDALYYFKHQGIYAILGLIAMLAVSRVNYQWFRGLSPFVLGFAVLLLVAVLIPHVGITRNNATRWLGVGSLTLQPSEVAKIGVVMYFSAVLCKRKQGEEYEFRDRLRQPFEGIRRFWYRSDLHDIWKLLVILIIIAALLIKEPHLSATILIFAAAAAILFVAGVKLYWFLIGGGLCGVGVWFLLVVVGYNGTRIKTWKNPWWDPGDKGFQIVQSLYAVASGGLNGLGLGLSRQKYLYLPEEQNDFIFAIICEELGFIGAVIIIALFAMLIIRGYWLALHARDRFGSMLTVGIITLLAVQVFLNIAVVTNLIPCTGVSLPFFSSGGTALVIQMVEMGIILSVSRQIPAPAQPEE